MEYSLLRPSIKSGDLLAWTHRGWGSFYDFKIQMVRMFTRSEYSHVGIAVVINNRVFVLESVTPVIRLVPLSNLLPCYLIHTNMEWKKETEEKVFSMIGSGTYSEWEAVKSFFGFNSNTNDKWQCAEFANYVLSLEGKDYKVKETPSSIVGEATKMSPLFSLDS